MQQRDSVANTIIVASSLCIVCSVLVSASAVLLRAQQTRNRAEEMQKNILQAAGVYDASQPVREQYDRVVEARLVDLETGRFSDAYDAGSFNQDRAAVDPSMSSELTQAEDVAGIKRRESFSLVYIIDSDDGKKLVLPIRGYGLWSTLRGFIALDYESLKQDPQDFVIKGITYYSHKETPGLGGEVDNPDWKAKWNGKRVYDDAWDVEIEVVKGASGDYAVDALSGATITSQGVTNMLQFWMGENGFRPFLKYFHGELQGDDKSLADVQG
jgi:Na+-transporting NADH:ubiquinone oxidoreductase subunit C